MISLWTVLAADVSPHWTQYIPRDQNCWSEPNLWSIPVLLLMANTVVIGTMTLCSRDIFYVNVKCLYTKLHCLASETNNPTIAFSTVCTQGKNSLWWSVNWTMIHHGPLWMLQSPTHFVKICQLLTTACKTLFREPTEMMCVTIYSFFCLSKRISNRI